MDIRETWQLRTCGEINKFKTKISVFCACDSGGCLLFKSFSKISMNNGNDVLENVDVDLLRHLSNGRWKKIQKRNRKKSEDGKFICFHFAGSGECPQASKAHLTRCDMYYKCVKLPSDNHVWIPTKCPTGLIYEHLWKMCVLPGECLWQMKEKIIGELIEN